MSRPYLALTFATAAFMAAAAQAQTPPPVVQKPAPAAAQQAAKADAKNANAQAEAAFRRADTNGDGKLSRTEADHLPEIAARFEQLDTNRDQFISIEEFNKVVAM